MQRRHGPEMSTIQLKSRWSLKIMSRWRARSKTLTRAIAGDPWARYRAAEVVASFISSEALLGDRTKLWMADSEFHEQIANSGIESPRLRERYWVICQYVKQTVDLVGATAECGVYRGASSWLICKNSGGKPHYCFDSFTGLSEPGEHDGAYWRSGDLASAEEVAQKKLAEFPNVTMLTGWIPERFGEIKDQLFSFVHVDVDLYEPTKESLEFFYPRLVDGGIVLFDDYGFETCPGARKAVDDFMSTKREEILHLPTGQGVIVRRLV